MSKVKLTFTALAAIIAFSAIASVAASAAAPGWMVEGKDLAAGDRENMEEAVVRLAGYKLASGTTEIECTTLKIEGGFIEGVNRNGAKSLKFTGCKALTVNCTLSNPAISTLPILSEATLDPPNASAAVIVFKPETGTLFATFKFEGEKCPTAGIKPVTGTQAALAPTGATEKATQVLTTIELVAGELKLGSAAAKLTASLEVKLESGKPFSFL